MQAMTATLLFLLLISVSVWASPESETNHDVGGRWKRDESGGGWKLPGSSYLNKIKKLVDGYSNLPPGLKQAIQEGDFSKVKKEDIQEANVTILEYVPNKVFQKADVGVLTAFLDKFLENDRSSALGRLVEAAGSKLSTDFLLDKLKESGGQNLNVSSSVLLHSAVSQLGDKGISQEIADRLVKDNLVEQVPEEQLMKVKDSSAATTLLNALSQSKEDKDVDDKSLMVRLVQVAMGPAKEWGRDSLRYLELMPGSFLKGLSPQLVDQSLVQMGQAELNPLQAKALAEVQLENSKDSVRLNPDGTAANTQQLNTLAAKLGKLAAFIPPSWTKNPNILATIAESCGKLNLPAPIQSIATFFQQKLAGSRKISDLSYSDFRTIPSAILKNSPPSVISMGMSERGIERDALLEIGDSAKLENQGQASNSFFQGLISQLSGYAVKYFGGESGRIDFSRLPGAFMGALGINGIKGLTGNNVDTVANNLNDNPNALDDIQKMLLIRKMRDMRDDIDLPPDMRELKGRGKGRIDVDDVDGLPSDSALRLAFGNQEDITLANLHTHPELIGTLTPKQVEGLSLESIPSLLALVRDSRDGPPAQTLQALHKRLVDYIRWKSDDYDSEDKKLLKHVTAAQVSKLPATVLAYFIDHRQTGKLPAAVRKEILVAMGELSSKDHATIPSKTREEIILQGLDALDEILDKDEKYGVSELGAMAHAVVDLPPEGVARLTPQAVEQALPVIQGTADDDGDGLKQRPCLTQEQRKAWAQQIISAYGSPDTWSSSTTATLCCTLEFLSEEQLRGVDKYGIASCQCTADLPPPPHLVELKKSLDSNCKFQLGDEGVEGRKMYQKIKSERSLDIEDLEDQILRRRRRSPGESPALNCYALRLTGSAAPFSTETLDTLDAKEMKDCLWEVGVDKLSPDNAKLLWKKLVQAYGGSVSRIPPETLRLANHVLAGIPETDVPQLNFTNPDVVASFGRPLGLSKNVLRKMASHYEEAKKYPPERFYAEDIILARNILCGFEKEKLATLNNNYLREALPILRSLEPSCEQTRVATLGVKAATLLGDIREWDASHVRSLGTLVGGLTIEAKDIPPEAFLGLTPTVTQGLREAWLKELSGPQAAHIPVFSAQALTEEQLGWMSEEGRESLEGVRKGPLLTSASPYLYSCLPLTLVISILSAILSHPPS